jgi:hypothetical protein
MYEALGKRNFTPLQTSYPQFVHKNFATNSDEKNFAHFVVNFRAAIRNARGKLEQMLSEYAQQSRQAGDADDILTQLSAASTAAVSPALLNMIGKQHEDCPALLEPGFLNGLFQAIGVDPSSKMLRSIKDLRATNDRLVRLNAMCSNLCEQLKAELEPDPLSREYQATLKDFVNKNVTETSCEAIFKCIEHFAKQNTQKVAGTMSEQNQIEAENKPIEQAKKLHAARSNLNKLNKDQVNRAGEGAIKDGTPFEFDKTPTNLSRIKLEPAQATSLHGAYQNYAALYKRVTGTGLVASLTPPETPTLQDLLALRQKILDFKTTDLDASLKTKEKEVTAKLQGTLALFTTPIITGEDLTNILRAAKQTGWPNIGIVLAKNDHQLNHLSVIPIKQAISSLLTRIHNQAGELLHTHFCVANRSYEIKLGLSFLTLAFTEALGPNDKPILAESVTRMALYKKVVEYIAEKNWKAAAKVASQLGCYACPEGATTARRLQATYESALWQRFAGTLSAMASNTSKANQSAFSEALFSLDVFVSADSAQTASSNKHRTTTTPLGERSLRIMQIAGMICSHSLLSDFYTSVVSGKKGGASHAVIEAWMGQFNGMSKSATEGQFDGMSKSATEVHPEEIELFKLCWGILTCIHDIDQRVKPSKSGMLAISLQNLLTFADQHQHSLDGLTHLLAIRAACEWFTTIYELSCQHKTTTFDHSLIIDDLAKVTNNSSPKAPLGQPYLPIRHHLQQNLRFMIEGDARAEAADIYAWRRARLVEHFANQYECFLLAILEKPAPFNKNSDSVLEKLVAYTDLKQFCDQHTKPLPTLAASLKEITTLGDKLLTDIESAKASFAQLGHVNSVKESLDDNPELGAHKDSFEKALTLMLPRDISHLLSTDTTPRP